MSGESPSSGDRPLDLSAGERRFLIALLHQMIDEARYPLAPSLAPLRAILAKLDPQPPRPKLLPPLKVVDNPHPRRRRR